MIFPILILGLILRLISLNQSLWLDEATSALVAKLPLRDIFIKFLPGDFHPPFYYLLMKFWVDVFGNSEISLRIPSVLFGVATVYVVYKISKNYIAPILMATSGLAIYYSQEARMYSLAALLVSCLVYLFLNKRWLLFSVALLLVGLTDYVALLIVPVFFIVGYKSWKKILITMAPLIIGYLLWLPVFVKQFIGGVSQQGSNWWNLLGVPTVKNIALIPVKFIFGRIGFDNKVIYAVLVVSALTLFGYVLNKARNAGKIFWGWLVIPVVLGILISFKIPTISYFRFLFCLPALYILISKSRVPKVLIGIVLFVNLASSLMYLLSPRFHREDWRSAAAAVGNEKIVFPANSQKEALVYYGKGNQITAIEGLTPDTSSAWLSRYVWEIFDPSDSVRLKIESLGYNKTSEMNFNGVVFFKYARSN